jgi:hypothetical protein
MIDGLAEIGPRRRAADQQQEHAQPRQRRDATSARIIERSHDTSQYRPPEGDAGGRTCMRDR